MSTKICIKCKVNKESNNFTYHNPRIQLLNNECIDCLNILQTCITCNISKKLYNFNLINRNKKTYDKDCVECVIINDQKRKQKIKEEREEYSKKRYLENKEKILAKNKEWRDTNKEYRKIKAKEYRAKPEIKEHIKEKTKEYNLKLEVKEHYKKLREEHKEEKKEYDKKYREENKEKYQTEEYIEKAKIRGKKYYDNHTEEINKKNNSRRKYTNENYLNYMNTIKPILARKLNCKKQNNKYEVTITIDDLLNMWQTQEGECYLTKIKMDTVSSERSLKNVSIDQIDAGKGYSLNNIGLCCESINLSKMQMTKDEFIEQLKLAGKNIKDKFYENIIPLNDLTNDCKNYLLTLFNNKKLTNKIGIDNIINLCKKQGGKCAITGIEMTNYKNTNIKYRCSTNISVDKINSELGYVLDNIQLTCLWANTGKLIYTNEEYRNLLLEGYNNITNNNM